jgi:hypothetical protein
MDNERNNDNNDKEDPKDKEEKDEEENDKEKEAEEEEFDADTIKKLAQPTARSRIQNTNVDELFESLTAVEVVGVESSTHGRSCYQRICCGHYVRSTDKLVCRWEVQLIDETPSGVPEEVVQVYTLTKDGFTGCHIGYIPRRYYFKFGFQ